MPVDYSEIINATEKKPGRVDFSSIVENPKEDFTQPQPPPVMNKFEARRGAAGWLDDLESDLRHGGNRTFLGRALGTAQGRGDKGYSGLESGTTKGTADIVGSIPLGLVKTAQGVAEMHDHPVKGALKTLGGALQTATIPMAFAVGPAAEAGVEAIPSRAWAMQAFKDVAADAGNVPVTLSRSGNAILRAKELSEAGTSMPQSIGKLLRRVTDPNKPPITYSEARDFYSNISRLSADEYNRLNPIMKRQVGMIASALKDDIGDAAGQVGQAAKYYSAMKNYAQASRLLRAAGTIGNWALKATVAAGGVEGAKLIWDLKTDKK